ncbi:phage-related tail-host interaction protein [Lacticaseibacillus paracasei subsp. paracasei Lpp219]|nr:phage-related tail-host interaction protein [Lacticaseibacillus paracasei subsp. paracasei Lpp219]
MEYYFSDRKFNIMGVARTTGKGEWLVSADSEVKTTDDRPAIALTLTIPFKTEQEQAIDEMAAENNFVLYQDEEGNGHQMVIASVTHDTLAHIHTVVCTDAGNDLMNEVVGAYTADKAYTIADYILMFTNDSGWEIGINEFPTDVRTLTWTDEDTSLSRIKSVAEDFDAVLSFGFVFVGTTAVKRVINIRHEETSDSLISFEMNKDINNIVKTVDIYDMETSVKAYGATPDGSNDPINLIGYSWTDPTGQFVLDQYGFLHDTIAVQKYSRLLSNSNPNPTHSDWNRVKTFDSNSQATLLQAALADLKKYNHPNVNYEVDLANAPYVPLNQTVHIVDENQNLFLSAKVLSVERSRAGHYTKLTLGDYANEQPNLYSALKDMAVKIENIPKAIQFYPWIRYADDDKGTNMSAFPSGKKYMAIVPNAKSSVPSDNPADYAGKWALIQGPQGGDGKGSYTHVAYANSIDGKTDFSTTNGNGKMYLGIYVDQTQAGSTDPTKYSWALFKGEQGPQGIPGSNDVPYTYIQLGTPASPKKGDLWWHGTTLNDATALQYYNGTAWVDQSIQQAVLSIKKLQSIEIDSAIINSPDINAPFRHTALSDANKGNFSSGNTSMQYGHVNITGNVENDQGKADGHMLISDLGPSGFISRERTPDNAGDIQYANLQGGKLNLSTLISPENAATKKYVFSTYKSTDNVTYYWNNKTAYTSADVDWCYMYYSRRNNTVTLTVNISVKTQTPYNYLRLADIRTGYKPTNTLAGITMSDAHAGHMCFLYASTPSSGTPGWYVALQTGAGGYFGSLTYMTQDDYPTGDPFF